MKRDLTFLSKVDVDSSMFADHSTGCESIKMILGDRPSYQLIQQKLEETRKEEEECKNLLLLYQQKRRCFESFLEERMKEARHAVRNYFEKKKFTESRLSGRFDNSKKGLIINDSCLDEQLMIIDNVKSEIHLQCNRFSKRVFVLKFENREWKNPDILKELDDYIIDSQNEKALELVEKLKTIHEKIPTFNQDMLALWDTIFQ